MVQKQEEMNALNGEKLETSPPQEKGRTNKRKLADPPLPNTASLTEFPRYELPSLKTQNHDNEPVGEVSNPLNVEVSESVGWDDPFACYLEELLSSHLLTLFLNAMKQVIDCGYGYTDDEILKAMSGSRLYCGGDDLLSNIVNNTLSVLKNGNEGAGLRDYVFDDLQQLVSYTLVEMISLVKEVRPSLSTVEAMWRLLMCDLNVLQAFEVEGYGSVESCASKPSESLGAESNPPNSSAPDKPKPPQPNAQSNRSESLKFGNFPNTANSKNIHSCGKEVCSGGSTVCSEGVKSASASFTLVSEERYVSCRKGRTKKEMAMLRQKSCVDKIRTYGKGSGYNKAAKFASVGSFLLEKRVKSASDPMGRNSSSKVTTEIGVKVSLTEDSNGILRKSITRLDSPVCVVDSKGYITTIPATPTLASKKKSASDTATLAPSASEKKSTYSVTSASQKKNSSSVQPVSEKNSNSEAEGKGLVSAKPAPDYYAGIPYDASLGVYVPRDKRDELIVHLVPRLSDLQNEMLVWTDWANQKVKEATGRLLKDQPELRALRKEREEAQQRKRDKQSLEDNTIKRLSEMELALTNATSQFEKATNTARRLEVEQSVLKKEMEAAKVRAAESAESLREATERVQISLKDIQSWEGQKILLQEELKSQRDKVTVLQKEITKAENRKKHIEVNLKQEKTVKGKLAAQASAIKKERKELEAVAKAEEEGIKEKAETDIKFYLENIKILELEISVLKLKSDYSRVAALKKGVNDSRATKRENLGMTKVKRERECVMCLSEEMSVIFLPCAHQVLCFKCNQLHEKEGMVDCPSCRGTIERRIQARFARCW